jgi:hypothetical protein
LVFLLFERFIVAPFFFSCSYFELPIKHVTATGNLSPREWEDHTREIEAKYDLSQLTSEATLEAIVAHHKKSNDLPSSAQVLVLLGVDEIAKMPNWERVLTVLCQRQDSQDAPFLVQCICTTLDSTDLQDKVFTKTSRSIEVCFVFRLFYHSCRPYFFFFFLVCLSL